MRRAIGDDDVARLVRAAERMARLAQTIGDRAQQAHPGPSDVDADAVDPDRTASRLPDERLVHASREAIAAHRRKPDFGAPQVFGNPAWILMLELFAASRSGIAVSVKAASLTLGGAASTANRTILDLERLGLIASLSDDRDARRRLLRLTPSADAVLRDYLAQQIERREPALRLSLKLSQAEAHDERPYSAGEMQSPMDPSTIGTESILQ